MIHLHIVTPERKVVDRQVEEVVLPGSEGYLGVLPGHAPLLTALHVGEISYRAEGATHYASVAWGFAEVHDDQVTILAETAERAEEIDVERARRAQQRAEEQMRQAGDVDWDVARVALMKAMTRIRVAERV